ncbi:hypothetical protein OJAV_G00081970 [Oryzias javanicus]|uniref:Uncharacterized protein n=1 Tax=Oryzias javanicus TaxID=123683 RepID=A0A3S2MZ54_ORYJA|nr:hypothetical protein OJAV_G00081970 [Oryzias javanicus]
MGRKVSSVVFRVRGAASETCLCRRREMVGWMEGGWLLRVEWRERETAREMEAGEGPSLRGLEPGTDGAVLAVVQPSPSSSTATPRLATRQGVKAVCDALALGRSSVFAVCSAPLDLVTAY